MFNFHVNHKNLKQSATNLSNFLKTKGFNIPRNIILDATSKVFFVKNWNTIEAMSKNNIEPIKEERKKILCININLSESEVILLLNKSMKDTSNISFYMDHHKKDLNNNDLYFYFSSNKNFNNWVTFFILFCECLKEQNIKINKMEYFDISTEKSDWMLYFR